MQRSPCHNNPCNRTSELVSFAPLGSALLFLSPVRCAPEDIRQDLQSLPRSLPSSFDGKSTSSFASPSEKGSRACESSRFYLSETLFRVSAEASYIQSSSGSTRDLSRSFAIIIVISFCWGRVTTIRVGLLPPGPTKRQLILGEAPAKPPLPPPEEQTAVINICEEGEGISGLFSLSLFLRQPELDWTSTSTGRTSRRKRTTREGVSVSAQHRSPEEGKGL